MPFWLRILLLCTGLAVALLGLFGASWPMLISIMAVLAGAIPEVIRRTPSLYLPAQRLRYLITNAETTWEVGLRFTGEFTSASVDDFVRGLATTPDETKVLERTDTRFLIRFERVFTIEFLLGDDFGGTKTSGTTYSSLTVTVFDQVVSYRRSKKMLEDSLLPLIEKVRETFKPTVAMYSLRVRFEGHNPFFGMYVQQLKTELIDDFQFEFHLPSAQPNEYVRVGTSDIVVVAQSPDRFRRAALAGLTFGGVSA